MNGPPAGAPGMAVYAGQPLVPQAEAGAAVGLTPEAAPGARGQPPLAVALVIGLSLAALAAVCVFQGIQQVLIPIQVQAMDAAHKVRDLALLTTLAAALAVVGAVSGGALSDLTRSRFGRRTPWLVAMASLAAVLMIAASTVHRLSFVAVIYAAIWFCMNFYQSALSAVIPDRIPERSRGAISSAFGLGAALGLGLGVNAVVHLSLQQGYAALAALLLVSTTACVVLMREGPSAEPTIAAVVSDAVGSREPRRCPCSYSRRFGIAISPWRSRRAP